MPVTGNTQRRRPGRLRRALQRGNATAEGLRSQLWPVPAVGVFAALAAGVGIPELDAVVDASMPSTLASYLFGGGADAAREVLGTIASAAITITSLTFSLTLVTLQLASSQYTRGCSARSPPTVPSNAHWPCCSQHSSTRSPC